MKRILANDGINESGKEALEKAGFEVITENVPQDNLIEELKNYDAVLVRSATKIRKDVIDACSNISLIGRGGVGMDNIDVEYAKSKGIEVMNTPAASSDSVAELVFAHLFSMARFLPDSNRNMALSGDQDFKQLKKKYSKGIELRGKTLGIIGIGRIGQSTARLALGVGMKVVATDPFIDNINLDVEIHGANKVSVEINTISFEKLLGQSDFITVHVPGGDAPIIGTKEISLMKDGVGIVNAARGGVISEADLLDALETGKIAYAGLDVFENEPSPSIKILMQENISLTPHIGAATKEAQERIGAELAEKIIEFYS